MAKKIDITEKVKELMLKPEKIRNIGIVAHIDHGKCIAPETRVSLYNGENLEAEKIFEIYKNKGVIEKNTDKEIVINVKRQKIYVNSFDAEKGKVVKGKITHIWKMKKTEPLVEVSLHNGSKIKTTPEHNFLILDKDGDFVHKRADDLAKGDIVVCVRKLCYEPLSIDELKIKFLNDLSKDIGFYVNLKKSLREELHEKVLKYGRKNVWKDIGSPLKWKSFYHCVWRGRYRLQDLLKTAKLFDIEISKIYNYIKTINYRKTTRQRGDHSSVDLRLPQNEEEFKKFFWLVGIFFGDGNTEGNIDNADVEIHKRVKKIANEVLGVDVTVKKYGKKCPRIQFGSGQTFSKILEKCFNFPLKKKSLNISISPLTERAPKKLIANFLQGYLDADGTVEKNRSAVSVTSASKEMLKDVQLLLYKFDIASKINYKKNTLYISGRSSLENFREIGFSLQYKRNNFENLLKKSKTSKLEKIPVDSLILTSLRKKLNLSASSISKYYSVYERGRLGLTKPWVKRLLDKFDSRSDIPEIQKMRILACTDTVFSEVEQTEKSRKEQYVYDFTVEKLHNFVAEGIVIHNTTLTDNLLAGAGMISEELAGKQLYMDYDKQEQERGITIYSANVSMIHEYNGDYHLINLIDTPGHVDFGGDVTRAMRAVDGALVVVCAVEGVMPQTETVLRQALKERVKPVLFINKVDRLIKELKLTPESMQTRFMKIIANVNALIKKYAEDDYKKWTVNVNDGSVAFGSAYRNWAISVPFMKETGITFKDIIEYCSQDKDKELAKKAPLHKIVFNMIIKHLPNPLESQKYRIPKIWGGDLESDIGKSMVSCDPNGELACVVTKVYTDPHAGNVATARIFSGRIKGGQEVYLVGQHKKERVQQVCIYKGQQRITMDEITAGNIIGVIGLSSVFSGETLCDPEKIIHPFESIKHIFEPVVTKAIEAKKASDLPKIIEILRKISREDPSLKVEINQETGEHLVSGLGELHLEAKVERKIKEEGIEIESSPPIVVYRETVTKKAGPIEGKSPNKHNKFYIEVEPLPKEVYQAMVEDKIPEGEIKKKNPELTAKLRKLGMNEIDAKGVKMIYNKNIFTDATKGIQYLNEVMELLKQAFKDVMDEGPISKEPCSSLIVRIVDAELHEDSIHRGPAQVIPAVRFAIKNAMLKAGPTLLEPRQILRIETPQEEMGSAMKEVQNRRGEVLNVQSGEGVTILKTKMPVAEMFGFEGALKSATGGKGFYYLIDVIFEKIPRDLLEKTVAQIRTRKGLDPEFPKPEA